MARAKKNEAKKPATNQFAGKSAAATGVADARRADIHETARANDVTTTTVFNWIKAGCPVVEKGERGKSKYLFDLADVTRWRVDRAVDDVQSETPTSIDEAKRRKLTAEARLAELDVAKAEGALVSIELVEKTITDTLSNLRARLLGLGSDVAKECRASVSDGAARAVIDEGVRNALLELSNVELNIESEPERDDGESNDDREVRRGRSSSVPART